MENFDVIPSTAKEPHNSEEKGMLLLKRFPNLTQYPFNAEKVMDLILQLAVQGRLTASWRERHPELVSGANSAAALLEKIKAEKEKLIAEKKIHGATVRKEKSIPDIEKDEMSYEIPIQWEWCRIGQVGLINPRNKVENESSLSSFIPMPLISSGYGVHPNFESKKWSAIKKGYTHFQEEDVVVAKITPCFENSKAGVMKGLINGIGAGTTELHVFRRYDKNILPDFIYLIFKSPRFLEDGKEQMTGSAGQKRVPKDYVIGYTFGLPPLEEQKEIVRIVDQLKEEVDTLNRLSKERQEKKHQFVTSALHHLTDSGDVQHWNLLHDHFTDTLDELENVKKLRETILQLAVQGKLTCKWRTSHPELVSGSNSAASLLQQIKAEKEKLNAEKKIKKEKPLPEITEEEKPYELPEGWEWVRIGELITLKSGQDLNPDEYSDTEQIGLPYVTGASNIQNEKVTISRWTNVPRSIAYAGDLLLTCKGSGVGKMGWLDEKEAHIARQIMAINTVISDLKFIKLIVEGKFLFFKEQANGLIPGIDRGTVLNIVVGCPPLEEQKEIVRQVDHLMSLCDQLELHITTRNAKAEQLMKAVVGEVLEGDADLTDNNTLEDGYQMVAESHEKYENLDTK